MSQVVHRENGLTPERQQELREMTYGEYLRQPEWKAIRVRKLNAAGLRSQLSNKKGKLRVHHRTYDSPRGMERDEDLIVLTDKEHEIFHQHFRAEGQKGRLLPGGQFQGSSKSPPREERGPPEPVPISERDFGRLKAAFESHKGSQEEELTALRKELEEIAKDRRRKRNGAWAGGAAVLLLVIVFSALWGSSGETASGRVNCSDLTHAEAQELLRSDSSDPNSLDGDRDGEACESRR